MGRILTIISFTFRGRIGSGQRLCRSGIVQDIAPDLEKSKQRK